MDTGNCVVSTKRIMMKRVLKYIGFLFLVYVIVWSTVFISRPVQLPERTLSLGYPVSFVTVDFSNPATAKGGYPDYVLKRSKFNIKSSWETPTEVSRLRFILSYAIVLFAFYGIWWAVSKMIRKWRVKPSL